MSGPVAGDGADDALQRLQRQLRELHAMASEPSLEKIIRDLKRDPRVVARLHETETPISKTTLHRLFTGPKRPKSVELFRAVVEYLAKRAPFLDASKVDKHFLRMWVLTLDRDFPSAPGADDDGDGPDAGPNPARPSPRGPRPSGAPATDAGPAATAPFSLRDILDELWASDGDGGSSPNASAQLLMIDLGPASKPVRIEEVRGWSEALSMGSSTLTRQPTSAELRSLIAEKLAQPQDTAVLLLRGPVVWDSETGEAHFLARDSEFDDFGTLWNTVPYTEIQYAITESAAKSVFVVVLASRDPRIATATVPIAPAQWADTLYAHAGPTGIDVESRPASLLWLREPTDASHLEALLQALRGGASQELTTGDICNRIQAATERFGLPAPYAAARHGGESITLGRVRPPRFVLRTDSGELLRTTPEALRVRRSIESNADLAHTSATAIAMGRIAGIDVIAAACADGSLQLRDSHTGGLIQTLAESTPPITALAIGRAGNRDFIVAGSRDQNIVIWEVLQR